MLAAQAKASLRSRRGLDWCVFFVADVQTGFGPFVAVYLTSEKWTQVDIGFLLTVSGLVGLLCQAPCGALVDAVRSERALAAIALAAIGASAFAFAAWPIFVVALASRVLLAVASCTLGLALVAISLGLAGEHGVSARLGRNVAFASAGTAIAAATMGVCGYYFSSRAVFFLAGALTAPAVLALMRIRASEIGPASDAARGAPTDPAALLAGFAAVVRDRRILIFSLCVVLFHLANAAMLPLAASMVTLRSNQLASVMVAAAIVVPQFTVTALSPLVGHLAQSWGRRPLLLLGFGALAIRGVLFALNSDPRILVAIQIFDGVSAAALGVLVPLTTIDLTRESGHFNLAQGAIGCAMGVGASISTLLAGYVSDNFGSAVAFDMLAIFAVFGFVFLALSMPETHPTVAKSRESN